MKRKYFIFLIFFIVLSFIGFEKANAYVCYYSGENWTAKLKINPSSGASELEYDLNQYFKDSIKNWNNAYEDTSTIGISYVSTESCPENIIFYRASQGIYTFDNVYVSSDDDVDNIINKIQENENIKIIIETSVAKLINKKDDAERLFNSCLEFKKENNESGYTCTGNPYFACMWLDDVKNDAGGICSTDNLKYVSCGDAMDIPKDIPRLISFAVNLLKIVTPIVLIVISMITLVKAVMSSKEDEIKKAQNSLVKKVIAAVIVFFVISIVQFVILKVADDAEAGNIQSCLSCFLNNDCDGSMYYKTTDTNGNNICTYLNGVQKQGDKCDTDYN